MWLSRFSLMTLFKSMNLLEKFYLDLFLMILNVILYFLLIASQKILYNFSDIPQGICDVSSKYYFQNILK
jgi:hypothetical protein